MKFTSLIACAAIVLLSKCAPYLQDLQTATCLQSSEVITTGYSKANDLENAMKNLVGKGVPGIAIAVYSSEGWWSSTAGLAKIENQTPMQTCHLQYLQSISKTYMAVAVLKLYEQGKVDLNAPMTRYLPERYSRYISGAEKVTVRMLLNHTSGIPEYNFAPAYVSRLLQHPDHVFKSEDYLKFIDGKPLDFEPGSKYSYRNTNYEILALMTDAITGDHAEFIQQTIFVPLGLTQTFYRSDKDYPNYAALVNTYWDRHSDGIIENVSQMQRTNVASLIGDDGLVTTPVEAVKFLKGLMEGKLLSESTLALMKTWVSDSKGNLRYGLGLAYSTIQESEAYGHSGGGLGAGCDLRYFPEKNIYMFIAINLGTVTESPLHNEVEKTLSEIQKVLLR